MKAVVVEVEDRIEEEDHLAKHCVTISDMEFGLCLDVMHKAY